MRERFPKNTEFILVRISYFLIIGLNTEIYKVNLRIQTKYTKIRTRKNSVLDIFHAETISKNISEQLLNIR